MREKIIIKIGGSVLSPSEENIFDVNRALQIKYHLLKLTDKYQFVIVTGGGALARKYQQMLKEINARDIELNWAGLQSNNQNAVMMRCILAEHCVDIPLVSEALEEDTPVDFTEDFLTVGAARPGHSGDYDAVILARRTGAKKIYIVKDVDGVYDKDPDENPDAEMIKEMNWDKYINEIIGGREFIPKMAVPVDPKASKHAKKLGISMYLLGSDLDNLNKAIEGKEFIGTLIHP